MLRFGQFPAPVPRSPRPPALMRGARLCRMTMALPSEPFDGRATNGGLAPQEPTEAPAVYQEVPLPLHKSIARVVREEFECLRLGTVVGHMTSTLLPQLTFNHTRTGI